MHFAAWATMHASYASVIAAENSCQSMRSCEEGVCWRCVLQKVGRLAVWGVKKGVPPPVHASSSAAAQQQWTPVQRLRSAGGQPPSTSKRCGPGCSARGLPIVTASLSHQEAML